MNECAPAYLPDQDAPNTLYGFTLAEWQAAADRSRGEFILPLHLWDQLVTAAVAGRRPGFSSEAFLALARLRPDYARRIVARLELRAPDQLPDPGPIIAAWCAEAAADGSAVSEAVVESWRADLTAHLDRIRAIGQLAQPTGAT